jgi:hypothetical protein
MHDAAKDFQAAFIIANLDPLRALPILRVPGTGREPELSERQVDARRRVHQAMAALGGISGPAGSCDWHGRPAAKRSGVGNPPGVGWKAGRSQGRGGYSDRGLGMLAAHLGYGGVKRS